MLELCAFYIDYKIVKFTAINFRDRTSVKVQETIKSSYLKNVFFSSVSC